MRAGRDGGRLAMGFLAECGGTHVRGPNLDRTQTLLAQPLTMFSNLDARRLGT